MIKNSFSVLTLSLIVKTMLTSIQDSCSYFDDICYQGSIWNTIMFYKDKVHTFDFHTLPRCKLKRESFNDIGPMKCFCSHLFFAFLVQTDSHQSHYSVLIHDNRRPSHKGKHANGNKLGMIHVHTSRKRSPTKTLSPGSTRRSALALLALEMTDLTPGALFCKENKSY